jgi:hypothetical protein
MVKPILSGRGAAIDAKAHAPKIPLQFPCNSSAKPGKIPLLAGLGNFDASY